FLGIFSEYSLVRARIGFHVMSRDDPAFDQEIVRATACQNVLEPIDLFPCVSKGWPRAHYCQWFGLLEISFGYRDRRVTTGRGQPDMMIVQILVDAVLGFNFRLVNVEDIQIKWFSC